MAESVASRAGPFSHLKLASWEPLRLERGINKSHAGEEGVVNRSHAGESIISSVLACTCIYLRIYMYIHMYNVFLSLNPQSSHPQYLFKV